MSKVIYLIGAGASYGTRKKDDKGNGIAGAIERGVPIVNEFEASIRNYLIENKGVMALTDKKSSYPKVQKELEWLRDICAKYPTVDTYAKQLSITIHRNDYERLKNAIALFLTIIQTSETRDIRYDGFVASLIQNDGKMPSEISILSWNYDCQLEYVLRDFSIAHSNANYLWRQQNIVCKGFNYNYDVDNVKFNILKLNGTAYFTSATDSQLQGDLSLSECERLLNNQYNNNISFAWEEDDRLTKQINTLVQDTEYLVIIGYSFPYVNRCIDRQIVRNMPNLKKVYIQDPRAHSIEDSFKATISQEQSLKLDSKNISIVLNTSTDQFVIPNELE